MSKRILILLLVASSASAQPVTQQVALVWTVAQTNVDGTAAADLARVNIYTGNTTNWIQGDYTQTYPVSTTAPTNAITNTVQAIANPADWAIKGLWFATSTTDWSGNESQISQPARYRDLIAPGRPGKPSFLIKGQIVTGSTTGGEP